jgi:hypothetical protein
MSAAEAALANIKDATAAASAIFFIGGSPFVTIKKLENLEPNIQSGRAIFRYRFATVMGNQHGQLRAPCSPDTANSGALTP